MSAATRASSARARATIAAGLLKTVKPWGAGLGRNFDDCFEMNDGDDVLRHLLGFARRDPRLVEAMESHGYSKWVAMAAEAASDPQAAFHFAR